MRSGTSGAAERDSTNTNHNSNNTVINGAVIVYKDTHPTSGASINGEALIAN